MPCPCGSSCAYETCCGPFHTGTALPESAEALMRSRYTAFAKNEITYLKQTTWPAYQKHFDEAGYQARAEGSIWTGLEILETEGGTEADTKGTVTFIAHSMIAGQVQKQHEKSLFKKKSGQWYYVKPIE